MRTTELVASVCQSLNSIRMPPQPPNLTQYKNLKHVSMKNNFHTDIIKYTKQWV